MTKLLRVAALTALISGIAAGGCGRGSVQLPSDKRNILLISLDTLRRDRVGAHSTARRPSMPGLERFAEDCVIFDDATTPIPFTLPSHMTMMTGLYPHVHGVLRKDSVLGAGTPTLAEELRKIGYLTFGVYSNSWMEPKFGFDRGFDSYQREGLQLEIAPHVFARALDLLPAKAPADGERPVFLFVHVLDAHSDWTIEDRNTLPYYSTETYRREVEPDPASREYCSADGACATDLLLARNASGVALAEPTHSKIEVLYDAGVRALDSDLSRFFAELGRRGYLDRSAVVVLSDHGEEFWEHGQYLHNQIHAEGVSIPFLLRLPLAGSARRRTDPVQTVDLFPSLLQLAGVERLPFSQGADLLAVPDAGSGPRATFFVDRFVFSKFGIRRGRWKLIADLAGEARYLYDLVEDPTERFELSKSRPEVLEVLEEELREKLRRDRLLASRFRSTSEGVPLDEESERELRSLGYL